MIPFSFIDLFFPFIFSFFYSATSIKSTPTLGADCKCDEILQKPGGSGLNTSCHLVSFLFFSFLFFSFLFFSFLFFSFLFFSFSFLSLFFLFSFSFLSLFFPFGLPLSYLSFISSFILFLSSGFNLTFLLKASFTGGKVPISFYGCMGKDPFASFLKTKLSDSGTNKKKKKKKRKKEKRLNRKSPFSIFSPPSFSFP